MSFPTFCRKIPTLSKVRTLVLWATLPLFATAALADGTYQRTKDGKTIVWNQDPKPGDAATWSGDRDRDGYASGFGTLTWYAVREKGGKEPKETVYAYYFGNMIRGKFDGPVNGHSKGVTGHAIFSEGRRTSRWAAGPAPSWRVPRPTPEPAVEPAAETATAKADITNPPEFNPPPQSYGMLAAERPVPNFDSLHQQANPNSGDVPGEGPGGSQSPEHKPKLEIDDSLRSLTGPPAALRGASAQTDDRSARDSSVPGRGHLNKQEALELADGEARKRGYDLAEYGRPDPQFDPIDNTWSLFYEHKAAEGMPPAARHFTVAIDDKTKRTAVLPAR